jgi:hypothetical protein
MTSFLNFSCNNSSLLARSSGCNYAMAQEFIALSRKPSSKHGSGVERGSMLFYRCSIPTDVHTAATLPLVSYLLTTILAGASGKQVSVRWVYYWLEISSLLSPECEHGDSRDGGSQCSNNGIFVASQHPPFTLNKKSPLRASPFVKETGTIRQHRDIRSRNLSPIPDSFTHLHHRLSLLYVSTTTSFCLLYRCVSLSVPVFGKANHYKQQQEHRHVSTTSSPDHWRAPGTRSEP